MVSNPERIHEIEYAVKKKKITKQDIKRWATYAVLTGSTLTSAYSFGAYYFKPDLNNELNVLRGTSSYLKSYEDNDPTKAFIYTKFSLENVRNNPNVNGVKSLEDEITKVENDIRTSTNKLVFKPVLGYIATRIDDIVNYNKDNNKDTSDFLAGIFFGVASVMGGILSLAYGIFDKKK